MNAVMWAWEQRKRIKDEPPACLLTLVAYAYEADRQLDEQSGYAATSPGTVADMIGLSTSTVRTYTRKLLARGLLVEAALWPGTYRVPESAFHTA